MNRRIDEIEVSGYGEVAVKVDYQGETPCYVAVSGSMFTEESGGISFTIAESKALRKAMKKAERRIIEAIA